MTFNQVLIIYVPRVTSFYCSYFFVFLSFTITCVMGEKITMMTPLNPERQTMRKEDCLFCYKKQISKKHTLLLPQYLTMDSRNEISYPGPHVTKPHLAPDD